jgi:hypothetical protein
MDINNNKGWTLQWAFGFNRDEDFLKCLETTSFLDLHHLLLFMLIFNEMQV